MVLLYRLYSQINDQTSLPASAKRVVGDYWWRDPAILQKGGGELLESVMVYGPLNAYAPVSDTAAWGKPVSYCLPAIFMLTVETRLPR